MSKAGWSRRLNEEAEEKYRHRTAAKARVPGSEVSSDKPIRIVMDESGKVQDILIAHDWRDAIPSAELGRALLDAVNGAMRERIATQTGDVDAGSLSPPDQPPTGEMRDLIRQTIRDLADFTRQARASMMATTTGSGAGRHVTVTLRAAMVSDVSVDPRWTETARRTEIRAEALSAFTVAQNKAPLFPSVQNFPAMIRLQQLMKGSSSDVAS